MSNWRSKVSIYHGVNALEEIGIPIQTLHRLVDLLEFSDEADVDELSQYLRDTQDI